MSTEHLYINKIGESCSPAINQRYYKHTACLPVVAGSVPTTPPLLLLLLVLAAHNTQKFAIFSGLIPIRLC